MSQQDERDYAEEQFNAALLHDQAELEALGIEPTADERSQEREAEARAQTIRKRQSAWETRAMKDHSQCSIDEIAVEFDQSFSAGDGADVEHYQRMLKLLGRPGAGAGMVSEHEWDEEQFDAYMAIAENGDDLDWVDDLSEEELAALASEEPVQITMTKPDGSEYQLALTKRALVDFANRGKLTAALQSFNHQTHGGAAGSFRADGCELCPEDDLNGSTSFVERSTGTFR
jgi:hypothetical protein